MIIRSIYFRSIQVGGKVLRGLAGPDAGAGGNVLVKPLIWGRNQTRGTPYAATGVSAGEGARPANAKYRFWASEVSTGRQKRGYADVRPQFLKSFSKIGSFIFQDPINNKT
jgi:hypothetical protein